nr:mechanosensitive ion channel family protein [Lysinibacter cavernae]
MWQEFLNFLQTYQVPISVVIIIVVAVVLRFVLIKSVQKVVTQIVTGAKKSQNVDDTQAIIGSPLLAARLVQRTRTLGSVSNNLITITISAVALVMILGQFGVNLTAVLASAGIVAAGLAFGAQNIVKDVLNGIFMVFEDQLGVGDEVEIGEVSGRVEAVGIRITQVRDVHGTLWFIRNGEIARVGNRSHDWSRAILDLAVAGDADIELAKEVIQSTAETVVRQPRIAARVLEQPAVWGLEYVNGDQVIIRLVVKTRSGSQWEISRVLREALKLNLDQAGITLSSTAPVAVSFSGVDGPPPTPRKPNDYRQGPPKSGRRRNTQ